MPTYEVAASMDSAKLLDFALYLDRKMISIFDFSFQGGLEGTLTLLIHIEHEITNIEVFTRYTDVAICKSGLPYDCVMQRPRLIERESINS